MIGSVIKGVGGELVVMGFRGEGRCNERIADMFGLTLGTYHNKARRSSESSSLST